MILRPIWFALSPSSLVHLKHMNLSPTKHVLTKHRHCSSSRTRAVCLFSSSSSSSVDKRMDSVSTYNESEAFVGEGRKRIFKLIPYGSTLTSKDSSGKHTISCDGRIPGDGVTLELTHWTNNITPDELYADTSTEMALNLAKKEQTQQDDSFSSSSSEKQYIVNNHYDTDGVLSCWTCLFPTEAKYETLLIHGAEAGDFGEWSSDNGIKLDATLEGICAESSSEEVGYQRAFEELPKLLNDLTVNDGNTYKKYWKSTLEEATNDWNDIIAQDGKVSIEVAPFTNDKVIILDQESKRRVSSYALHRYLIENKLFDKCQRILRVTPSTNSNEEGIDQWTYEYEKVGHGWVQKLKDRPLIANVKNVQTFIEMLNNNKNNNDMIWKTGGSSGLVAICQTTNPITISPNDVANLMLQLDDGLS